MTKAYCVLMLVVFVMASCGSKKENANTEEFVANDNSSATQTPVDAIARGEALVKSNDCSTCHHRINTIIGPAHTDVAKKYEFTEANVKLLAGKILQGGTGVWGQIPMNAHADISQDDAEAMARYVLSLDNEKEH